MAGNDLNDLFILLNYFNHPIENCAVCHGHCGAMIWFNDHRSLNIHDDNNRGSQYVLQHVLVVGIAFLNMLDLPDIRLPVYIRPSYW